MFIAPSIRDSDDLLQYRDSLNDGEYNDEFSELFDMLSPIK
jgi:hypothetical protein